MRELYKGKFPTKNSTFKLARACVELQSEVIKLRRILKEKLGVTDHEIDFGNFIN